MRNVSVSRHVSGYGYRRHLGYVKTHIVLPSYVYGVGKGRLLDLGIQHPHSIILPFLINFALERGSSFIVGEGKNVCANVEVGDREYSIIDQSLDLISEIFSHIAVADLYLLLFNAIIEEKNPAHGREGFYNGASGEHSQYEGSKAVATVLFRMGLLKSDEPTPLTEAEIKQVELVRCPCFLVCMHTASDALHRLWRPPLWQGTLELARIALAHSVGSPPRQVLIFLLASNPRWRPSV